MTSEHEPSRNSTTISCKRKLRVMPASSNESSTRAHPGKPRQALRGKLQGGHSTHSRAVLTACGLKRWRGACRPAIRRSRVYDAAAALRSDMGSLSQEVITMSQNHPAQITTKQEKF